MNRSCLKFLLPILVSYVCCPAIAQACQGTLIDYKAVYVDGTKIAQLQLYYDAGTGRNCAMMYHAGPTWGLALETRVSIAPCFDNTCTSYTSPVDFDDNVYRFWAGPVSINGRGRCIWAQGQITYRGQSYLRNIKGHCD